MKKMVLMHKAVFIVFQSFIQYLKFQELYFAMHFYCISLFRVPCRHLCNMRITNSVDSKWGLKVAQSCCLCIGHSKWVIYEVLFQLGHCLSRQLAMFPNRALVSEQTHSSLPVRVHLYITSPLSKLYSIQQMRWHAIKYVLEEGAGSSMWLIPQQHREKERQKQWEIWMGRVWKLIRRVGRQ